MPTKRLYSAAEIREIKSRLLTHRQELASRIAGQAQSFQAAPTFDVALEIRDAAQLLLTTCHCLESIDLVASVAERGGPQSVPHLDECGLGGAPSTPGGTP